MGSMGKGQIWINGESIGRYWTVYAPNGDCNGCSYAGSFRAPKCQTGCGQPTQRWYVNSNEYFILVQYASEFVYFTPDHGW